MIQYGQREDNMLFQSRGRHQRMFMSHLFLVILAVFILSVPGCNKSHEGQPPEMQQPDSTSAAPAYGDSTAKTQTPDSLQSAQEGNLIKERKDVEQRMSRFLALLDARENAVLKREQAVMIKESHVRRVWIASIILFIIGLAMLIIGVLLTLHKRKSFKIPEQEDEPVQKRSGPSGTAKE